MNKLTKISAILYVVLAIALFIAIQMMPEEGWGFWAILIPPVTGIALLGFCYISLTTFFLAKKGVSILSDLKVLKTIVFLISAVSSLPAGAFILRFICKLVLGDACHDITLPLLPFVIICICVIQGVIYGATKLIYR